MACSCLPSSPDLLARDKRTLPAKHRLGAAVRPLAGRLYWGAMKKLPCAGTETSQISAGDARSGIDGRSAGA